MIRQALAVALAMAAAGAAWADDLPVRAWTLLNRRCIACHGPDEQEGALRLDAREAALAGGKHGPALVPGKPADSLLLKTVLHEDRELSMPPNEQLSARELRLLREWIAAGASWPAASPHPAETAAIGEQLGDAWHDPRNPIAKIFGGERLDLWSLKPVAEHAPPDVDHPFWGREPIDCFLYARLKAEGLEPAPSAEKRTLVRRLYFDLTGLPPSPEDAAAFLADESRLAYEHLVDRLLASPHYGEHMARWWLDVVRYSESNGFDWDEFRPQAWRYRDYVIRSLAADKPYDAFLREQLAGDELLEGPPRNAAEQDCLIATGFLRLGPQDNSAGAFDEQVRARAEWMSDLVETTGSAMLGLTLACCRCHDHKYDPLAQADYYRFRAFFEPLRYGDDVPLNLLDEQQQITAANKQLDLQVESLEAERTRLQQPAAERVRETKRAALSAGERKLLDTPEDQLSPDDRKAVETLKQELEPQGDEQQKALTEAEKHASDELKARIDALQKQRPGFDHGLVATDGHDAPATHLLQQGDVKHPGEAVAAGFPSVLDPNPAPIAKPEHGRTHGRRLALANWIASPENPWTARVLVNRIWQLHFGRGLVATANDFGLAGAPPTHPELLDYLADEFVSDGWSIKRLQRRIVMSAAYRQQALAPPATDVENGLYARQNLRRLTAEQLRDALLMVAGLLTDKHEGPPVWPELPAAVLAGNPALLDDNAEKTKGWYPSPADQQYARSIFLVQKRSVPVPFLETFDLPSGSVSCPRRNSSTVAPQALSLLNSPLAVSAARGLAARVQAEAGTESAAQVRRLFQLALARDPQSGELSACQSLLASRSLVEVARVVLNLNEFIYLD